MNRPIDNPANQDNTLANSDIETAYEAAFADLMKSDEVLDATFAGLMKSDESEG